MLRARERVRDDAALVGDVASSVSRALGLDSTNRTLGRNIVIAAVDAHIAAVSAGAAGGGGGGGGGGGDGGGEDSSGGGGGGKGGDLNTDAAAAIAAAIGGGASGGGSGDALQRGEAEFQKAAKGYGPLGDAMLSDMFRKVTTRLRGSLVQLQAAQEEEDGGGEGAGPEEDGGVAGFGKAERMSGFGVGRALKGGLVKRHTFQVLYTRGCNTKRLSHSSSR